MVRIMMLKLFVLLVALGACAADDCPDKYRRFSNEHIFCTPPPPNEVCQVVWSGLQEFDKVEIVRLHNEYRSKVATGKDDKIGLPSAANMLEMEWDEELASVAQKHADQCIFEHECNDCRRVPNFSVGQNLYQFGISGSSEPSKVDWEAAVRSWYEEIQYFSKDYIEPFVANVGEPATGHFTQVVWATSFRVGCGHVTYKIGEREFKGLYTCNYGEAGNMPGGSMYQVGKECSKCPLNSCCGGSCSQYAGLCKMQKDEAPRYPPPNDATFFCSFNGEKDCAYSVTEGAKKWEIKKTLSGNFLTAVLEGGESSKITFVRHLSAKSEEMCLIFTYGEGPDLAGEKCDHQVALVLQVGTYVVDSKMKKCITREMRFSMGLGWNMNTQVHFTFSVPQGAPRQFFQLSNMMLKEGTC